MNTAEEIPAPSKVREQIESKKVTRRMLLELSDDEKYAVHAKRLLAEVDRANKAYDDLAQSRRNAGMLLDRCDAELAGLEKLLQKSERKSEYLKMLRLREKLAEMELEVNN